MYSRHDFFSTLAAGAATASLMEKRIKLSSISGFQYYVIDFRIAGDVKTPSTEGFQQAFDEAEKNGSDDICERRNLFINITNPTRGQNLISD